MGQWIPPLLFGLLVGALADAKTPDWARKYTQTLSGKVFITACSGTGPSVDSARRDALDSCRLSARQQLAGNIKVRAITVQSERSSGFHEEISENTQYSGLICNPVRDEVEEFDGSFRVWVQCRFELDKVKMHELDREKDSAEESDRSAAKLAGLGSLQAVPASGSKTVVRDEFVLLISVVPKCDSLIVRGAKARQLICSTNPIRVVLYDSDKEILVRAAGFRPKAIEIKGGMKNETIQILLEKN